MVEQQENNPLHGITLKSMLEQLIENYEWEQLSQEVDINCFKSNPTLKSCLNFLRKTPWARQKVEDFYLSVMKYL